MTHSWKKLTVIRERVITRNIKKNDIFSYNFYKIVYINKIVYILFICYKNDALKKQKFNKQSFLEMNFNVKH